MLQADVAQFGTRPNDRNRPVGRGALSCIRFTYLATRTESCKGMTSNIAQRIRDHKLGYTRTTSRFSEIKLVYQEKYETFAEARKRELYFKSSAGRRFLKNKSADVAQLAERLHGKE